LKNNHINKDKQFNSARRTGVAFFPTLESLAGNPYWPILAAELEKKGINFDHQSPATFNLRWLVKNRMRIKILNLHFIQQFYKSSTTLRKLVKLCIFTSNMLIARILGYRTIFTLHNLEPTYEVKPAWVDYTGHWIAANLSQRVIVYCKEARRLLKARYGRSKDIYFVDHPNLIDYYPNMISKENARNWLSLPSNAFVFAFVGGIRPNKGVELLIQAFRNLSNPNYRLIIAGGVFPPESYALSLKDLAVGDDRISFKFQRILDEDFQIYLNAANVVVLPFSKILTSGTANLAMSFGCPVIAPVVGCLPELIEPDLGWVFEQGNVDSLGKVMELAANSAVDQIGKRAFEKILDCSPDRFVLQTMKAYYD